MLVMSAPSPAAPYASSASIQSPDSRVSRPTSRCGVALARGSARTSAAPSRRTVARSSGYSPATPRTPSVPKSLGIVLFATGDPDLYGRRLDVRDARVAPGVGFHGQLILTRAQARQIDVRQHVVGLEARDGITAAAY